MKFSLILTLILALSFNISSSMADHTIKKLEKSSQAIVSTKVQISSLQDLALSSISKNLYVNCIVGKKCQEIYNKIYNALDTIHGQNFNKTKSRINTLIEKEIIYPLELTEIIIRKEIEKRIQKTEDQQVKDWCMKLYNKSNHWETSLSALAFAQSASFKQIKGSNQIISQQLKNEKIDAGFSCNLQQFMSRHEEVSWDASWRGSLRRSSYSLLSLLSFPAGITTWFIMLALMSKGHRLAPILVATMLYSAYIVLHDILLCIISGIHHPDDYFHFTFLYSYNESYLQYSIGFFVGLFLGTFIKSSH